MESIMSRTSLPSGSQGARNEQAGKGEAVSDLIRGEHLLDMTGAEPGGALDLVRGDAAAAPRRGAGDQVDGLVRHAVGGIVAVQVTVVAGLVTGFLQHLAGGGRDGVLAVIDAACRNLPAERIRWVAVGTYEQQRAGLVENNRGRRLARVVEHVMLGQDRSGGQLNDVAVQGDPIAFVDGGSGQTLGFHYQALYPCPATLWR